MTQNPNTTFTHKIEGIYVALLGQSGTNPPVATVLQNGLGEEVTWTRDDVGRYRATVDTLQLFSPTKCVVEIGSTFNGTSYYIYHGFGDYDFIRIITYNYATTAFADGQLAGTMVRITVYH